LPVVEGQAFFCTQKKQALKYARKIKFPVVLKPTTGGHGDYVYSGIDSIDTLSEKIDILIDEYISPNGYFLVEKHLPGNEYRIFYSPKLFAIVHRVPANITGDGENSIINLIQAENYRRMNPRQNCLCEIKLDDILFDHLESQQLSITDIPKKNQNIQLRLSSNVTKGGNCYDVTFKTHQTVTDLAKKVLNSIPHLQYLGMDLICEDISKPLHKQSHAICELNPAPGLSLHLKPEKGRSKNVAKALANLLFPQP